MITVIGNMKGGTGKSTLAFNLAVWLAHNSDSTDSEDPIILFDLDPQKTLSDVIDVRTEENYEPVLPTPLLASEIEDYEDYPGQVLMDVSMSDGNALRHAIRICDEIVIPVGPSQADIWSTQRFIKIIKEERVTLPKIYGVINRADTHPLIIETQETEEAMDYLPHIERIKVRLHNRTSYRRSFSEGLAVFEQAPASKASKEFKKVATIIFKD